MARRGGELLSRDCDVSPQAHPGPLDAPIPRVLTASAASPRHAVVLSEPGKHWKEHRQLVTTTRVQTAAPFLRKPGVVLSEPGRSRAGRDSRVPRGLRPQSCRLNPPTTPPKPWSHCRGQEAPSEYTRRPVSRNEMTLAIDLGTLCFPSKRPLQASPCLVDAPPTFQTHYVVQIQTFMTLML